MSTISTPLRFDTRSDRKLWSSYWFKVSQLHSIFVLSIYTYIYYMCACVCVIKRDNVAYDGFRVLNYL